MAIRLVILCILISHLSCKSKQTHSNSLGKNPEIITIKCSDNEDCLNETYSLKKVYESEHDFRIEHLGKTVFKANEKGKTFLYEVYASNYLLIYYISTPNNFASPWGNSDVFYLIDLSVDSTYRFEIGKYRLTPFRFEKPIHAKGTKTVAFLNNIDIKQREITLLFSDFQTDEKLPLEAINY